MKLKKRLVAVIVSISVVLAVLGVGAWATANSFAVSVSNTINMGFNNLSGDVILMGASGVSNLQDGATAPFIDETPLYYNGQVLYNRISSEQTNGTNLYWDGAKFLDTSDNGLGLIREGTTAAVLLYGFIYSPTADCDGSETITAMVTETSAPEVSGAQISVRYFATNDTNLQYWRPISSGVPITLVHDNEMLVVLALCQYHNLSGTSVATIAGKWDFNVQFSAGSEAIAEAPNGLLGMGGIPLDVWGFSDGEILPPSTTINDTSKIWKIVEFGEYPQTLKAENVTITSQTPDADGYYLGSDGARYAKQVAIGENDNTNSKKTKNGVILQQGQEYYFKVEPIRWRVLEQDHDKMFVVSDVILDVSVFQDDQYDNATGQMNVTVEDDSYLESQDGVYTDGDTSDPDHPDFVIPTKTITTDANNYVYSDLRKFLNQDFFDKAFDDEEKEDVIETLITNGDDRFDHADTTDNVFALSTDDYNNDKYKLNKVEWAVSDYALAKNAFKYTKELMDAFFGFDTGGLMQHAFGDVWFRSPSPETSAAYCADARLFSYIEAGVSFRVSYSRGCVPAMYISR